jgi:hypothetical protein
MGRMKPTVIAAIMLAFAAHVAPRCEAEERSADVAKCAANQEPSALTALMAFDINADQQGSASSSNAAQNNSPDWNEPSQWIFVIITGITAGFICWQSWETRKAAQASQKSVKAAERSTDILVSSERAWVSIKTDMATFDPAAPDAHHYFHWRIQNTGKSVAELISTDARCLIWNGYDDLPELPELGHAEIIFNGRILAPNEPYPCFTYFEDWQNGTYSMHGLNARFDATPDILCLLAFGRVRYRTLGQDCESNFVEDYTWVRSEPIPTNGFRPRLESPSSYTKHT